MMEYLRLSALYQHNLKNTKLSSLNIPYKSKASADWTSSYKNNRNHSSRENKAI